MRDIVGLYLSPPTNSVVFCVDEKSQVQALERTQPLLPLRPGHPERRTHDYARHGTTTLFAALNVATGEVLRRCEKRHRHQEYLRFLNDIDASVPPGLEVHLVVDNYATHKTPRVMRWFAKRPRFHIHFTPTYSSWINQVERLFAEVTNKAIKAGQLQKRAVTREGHPRLPRCTAKQALSLDRQRGCDPGEHPALLSTNFSPGRLDETGPKPVS